VSPAAHPRFTIVVPTRDRAPQLRACLAAIERLAFPRDRFEAIVVDDGGRTPIEPIVERAADHAPVRLVRQDGAGPGMARNRGAEEGRGEIVAFLDDDCAPDRAWLAELDRVLSANPGAGVGGRTINALPGNPYSSASQSLIDYLYEYYNTHPAVEPLFTTSNLALPRAEFLALGGFDRRFSRAGGEDRELCLRWARSGREILFAPGAIVRHAHQLRLRSFLRQHFTYGRGAARFHRIRKSGPIPEPPSFYRELVLYPWRGRRRGRARQSALLALSQVANVAGYAWEIRHG
jgi:GT2 family glycosyltransferase